MTNKIFSTLINIETKFHPFIMEFYKNSMFEESYLVKATEPKKNKNGKWDAVDIILIQHIGSRKDNEPKIYNWLIDCGDLIYKQNMKQDISKNDINMLNRRIVLTNFADFENNLIKKWTIEGARMTESTLSEGNCCWCDKIHCPCRMPEFSIIMENAKIDAINP